MLVSAQQHWFPRTFPKMMTSEFLLRASRSVDHERVGELRHKETRSRERDREKRFDRDVVGLKML
ncbi:MAG: hypothetical protein CO150_09185 [Nitrospirae bacterium CG_4_9_14_3_um_filter_53_35]|nr:MAG: hypothetical protein CO150_09185 [Nitrospirae bacterium CG_4_9_14_3_um_filter_53_35]